MVQIVKIFSILSEPVSRNQQMQKIAIYQGCGAGTGTGTGTGQNRIHLGILEPEPEPYSEYGSGSGYKEMKQKTQKNLLEV